MDADKIAKNFKSSFCEYISNKLEEFCNSDVLITILLLPKTSSLRIMRPNWRQDKDSKS